MKTQKTTRNMKRHFIWLLTSLILTGLLVLVSMSLAAGGTWTKKADMPTAKAHHCSDVVDRKIYVIGGGTGPVNFLKTVEEYDPNTDTWTKKADMPTARILDQSVSSVNGKIYAIGGNTAQGLWLSTVEEYDPKMDTWTKKADMPTPRTHLSTCAVDGKIYAIGGMIDANASSSIVEEYDPATDTWTRKADMLTPRCALDTAAVNGKIYAIGGTANWQNGPNLSTVEEYDPVTDTWTKKGDMLGKRWGVSAAVVNGKIYAIGGYEDPVGPNNQLFHPPEVYDPATDTWTELADMQVPRKFLSSSVVNGKIYAIGGFDNSGRTLSIVEEYTPEGWPFSVSPHGKLPTTWGEMKQK